MKHYIPTPKEIAEECACIRAEWSPETEILRSRGLTHGKPGGRDAPKADVVHHVCLSRERTSSIIQASENAV